jgi:hypothetical protein
MLSWTIALDATLAAASGRGERQSIRRSSGMMGNLRTRTVVAA